MNGMTRVYIGIKACTIGSLPIFWSLEFVNLKSKVLLMGYNVRTAELDDVERMQELSVKLSEWEEEEFDSTINPDWNTSEEATEWFEQRVYEGFAYVAVDEEIVGYLIGAVNGSEEYRDDLTVAELESMYLHPDYRGRGIGTELAEKFQQDAEEKGADRLRVEVTADNQNGREFYKALGLTDYAVTMEKEL